MFAVPPVRRVLAAVLTAGVVTVGGLLAVGTAPVDAAPATSVQQKKSKQQQKHDQREHGAEHDSQESAPAPPAPASAVPVERVVTTGQTPRKKTQRSAPTAQRKAGATAAEAPVAEPKFAAAAAPAPVTGRSLSSTATAKTLVLYDSTGPYGWLGEAYGMTAANLVSRFGSWTARPVTTYTANEMNNYTAVVYVGSTYDEPLPTAFLDDVLKGTKPVVWMYDNIWQLTARSGAAGTDYAAKYGYTWRGFDLSTVGTVTYKNVELTRNEINAGGIMDYLITDTTKVTTVATAKRPDGTTFPWALKSNNLTYIGEIPFSYINENDRYLAFSDMLYDVLAPATTERHRALVRIEDVGPDADPAELMAVANLLASKKIPYSVAVYPRYRDPMGVLNGGRAEDYTLKQTPLVVAALKYMQATGGTLIMHGYTHQLDSLKNPYDGVSANDFEFYLAHVDEQDYVRYDGPTKADSTTWAKDRISASNKEFTRVGLPSPTIFEFPHYAGSAVDYAVVNTLFKTRYDRGLYFPGYLSKTTLDYSRMIGQFYPYAVRDVYGTAVVPENLGNIEPEAFNNHPARLPADLVAAAKRNLVVRDGYASFFYHPYLGTDYLKQTVEGIQGLGYTFVSASSTVA